MYFQSWAVSKQAYLVNLLVETTVQYTTQQDILSQYNTWHNTILHWDVVTILCYLTTMVNLLVIQLKANINNIIVSLQAAPEGFLIV